MEPQIEYAQTKDGVSIAFWTSVRTNGTGNYTLTARIT